MTEGRKDGKTERWKDGKTDRLKTVYPLNYVSGGIIISEKITVYTFSYKKA